MYGVTLEPESRGFLSGTNFDVVVIRIIVFPVIINTIMTISIVVIVYKTEIDFVIALPVIA